MFTLSTYIPCWRAAVAAGAGAVTVTFGTTYLVDSTAPPLANPRTAPDSTACRIAMIAPWTPAAATSRAVHTCSPFDNRALIESDVPDPGPCTGPPPANPDFVLAKMLTVADFFPCAASQLFTVFVAPAVDAFTVMDGVFRAAQREKLLTVCLAAFDVARRPMLGFRRSAHRVKSFVVARALVSFAPTFAFGFCRPTHVVK